MNNRTEEGRWQFTDKDGTFRLLHPHLTNYLYFPLVNEAGMMSAVTPTLNGDIKADHNTFFSQPLSVEDLHNTRSARNFWIYVEGESPWSATGNAAPQIASRFSKDAEKTFLEAGLLWHKLTRENPQLGLQAKITSFVPASGDQVELMRVTVANTGPLPRDITPTAAIPIFGRSADNLRDHRHVTSLLHRTTCIQHGVLVCPSLSFDERGHIPNSTVYAVLGCDEQEGPPEGFFPAVETFIGEGGNLEWPSSIVQNTPASTFAGDAIEGYEALGGLRFPTVRLQPGEKRSWVLILAVMKNSQSADNLLERYGTSEKIDLWLGRTKNYWHEKLDNLRIQTGDPRFNAWMRWVSSQPIMRRLFGNSFLPYHDYGRGGRGWRDLWQDILALLLIEPENIREMLLGNFAGIRLDGSNATIIGSRQGEFKADRNEIPRVWMDHGAWPLLTIKLYIDQTGDLEFLLCEQAYFKDHLASRAQAQDTAWDTSQGTRQQTHDGDVYLGSVLEHLLVQHLSAFFNVGDHNLIKLEDADWNDGMDMAGRRGESVTFSALYASNLRQLGRLVQKLQQLGIEKVDLAAEFIPLLDSLRSKIDYDSIPAKQQLLQEFFASVSHAVSGRKAAVRLSDLAMDLFAKSDWMAEQIRDQEWISSREGYSWFNGYYDNDGQRLEGDHPNGVRMTLTGQVFPLMGGVATAAQAEKMIRAVDHYLFDASVGGYRLNTNFHEVLLNMGRCFGFAYGHKENGAMFSHMAVMYAYALYTRGHASQAYRALNQIYCQSVDFQTSRMYPGIPEYFNARGRGVYTYLTGAASWYLLTLVTQAFGVRGDLGDLLLAPQLVKTQFDNEGQASIDTRFADRQLHVTYQNPDRLEVGSYQIARVQLDEQAILIDLPVNVSRIPRKMITDLTPHENHQITIWLAAKKRS